MSAGARNRPLRLAMVGGGSGAFVGTIHRIASALDGRWRLVAGALSSTPERSLASARELGLGSSFRAYGTWQELIEGEARLAPGASGERAEAVCIVTPNALHAAIAGEVARAGLHVIIDKPMTATLAEAKALREEVSRAGVLGCVTYNYSGYPLVRHAGQLVASGALGSVRKVVVEYHQGWLATPLEVGGQKQAAWRTDPAIAGPAGSLGDIGSHAEQLLRCVTGHAIARVCADVSTVVEGRRVDDDAGVLLDLRSSAGARARGVLSISQVCVGEQNNLTLRVYGDRGTLWWSQETPDTMRVAMLQGDGSTTTQMLHRGAIKADGGGRAARATRLPSGHPEGFLEAFANIYRDFADAVLAREAGQMQQGVTYPTIDDGVAGMAFIDACLRSKGAWVEVA